MRPIYGVKNSTIGEEWWQDDKDYCDHLKNQRFIDEHCVMMSTSIEGAIKLAEAGY